MPLGAGSRLGPYEVVAPLGAGGMGEVYRARDPKLGREVAVKVLPSHLWGDSFSLERFEREAKAVAALSHPNIVRIFDYGRDGDFLYAVMELLEGESLRQRLRAGPLPVSKALEYATAVAEGLAAAHDRGITHRDLKPDNVFLNRDGRVKILDFGVAKVEVFEHLDRDGPTAALSQPGAMLGTIEYMAPEQIRGQDTDHRADVFALGVLLYEMLAGERPFQGESLPDTMTAILTHDPPPVGRERPLPPALQQILTHCLEKRPEDRFQSAHDLSFALTAASLALPTTGAAVPSSLPPPRRRLAPVTSLSSLFVLGVAALAFALGFWAGGGGRSSPAVPRATFTQLTAQPGVERAPDLAPDGKSFVFVAAEGGDQDVFLLRIGGQNPINLTAGSDVDDTAPAYSPDGELIAFRSERLGGGIFLMGATGESVRRLLDFGYDPDWSPDGRQIVVATEAVTDPLDRSTTSQLWAVQVADGVARQITPGDAVQPSWSPHGHRIAYFTTPSSGQRDLLTVAAEGGEPVAVTRDAPVDWSPVWSPDGRWLYFSSDRGGSMNVWRISIDEGTGKVRGEPQPLTSPAPWAGSLSLSADGSRLLFATLEERSTVRQVSLAADSGRPGERPSPVHRGTRRIANLDVSPDGSRLAFTTYGLREDLFVVGTDGSDFRQLTDDAYRDRGPRWSPDGERLAFYSNRSGRYELWTIRADGSRLDQLTRTPAAAPSPWYPSWSPDGRRLAVSNERGSAIVDPTDPAAATPLPRLDEERLFQVTDWSADGSQLAGLARHLDGTFGSGLFLYDLEEETFRQLAAEGTHPLWLGRGPRLLAAKGDGLAFFDPASQQWSPLVERGLGGSLWRSFAVAADGSRVVWIETEEAGDVWLARLQ